MQINIHQVASYSKMPPKKFVNYLSAKSNDRLIQYELFDANKLQYICSNYDSLKSEIHKNTSHSETSTKLQISSFFSMREHMIIQTENDKRMITCSKVTYRQRGGKGRYFANHSYSLQGMPRSIRHCIAGDIYRDMDIKNAHPVILMHMCEIEGLDVPQLKYYVNNREICLDGLKNEGILKGKCNQSDGIEWAKKQYLIITNWGEEYENGVVVNNHVFETYTPHLAAYTEEIRGRIHTYFANKESNKQELEQFKIRRELQGKITNINASYLNWLVMDYENRILQVMMDEFDKQTQNTMKKYFVPCFDGVMVPKCYLDGKEITYDIQKAMDSVTEQIGISVVVQEKPMNNGINLALCEQFPNSVYSPSELNTFNHYKKISGDPEKVYDSSTIDEWAQNSIFLLEESNRSADGNREMFKFIISHIRVDGQETYKEYQICETESIFKSLERYCKIINPDYDPEFYTMNKNAPKNHEVWNDIRMKPYLFTMLSDYLREKKKLGQIEEFAKLDTIPSLENNMRIMRGEDKIFNTFRGFPWVGKLPQKTQYNIPESSFYKYLCKYFFKNNLEQTNIFLDWIADMFQDPLNPKPYTPVIIGEQGTGKSLLGKLLTRLVGKYNAITITDTDGYFNQFNELFSGKILKIFEELSDGKIDKSRKNQLKGDITGDTKIEEGKGTNKRETRNFSRYLIITNDKNPLPSENRERRGRIYIMDSSASQNQEILLPVINEINDEDYVISFFNWITTRLYDPSKLFDTKRTEDTNDQILESQPTAIKFLKNFIEKTFVDKEFPGEEKPKDDYDYRFSSDQLNQEYRNANKKVGDETLKTQWAKIGLLPKQMRIVRGGKTSLGYVIYPPEVEKAIRKLTGVETFAFNLKTVEEIPEGDEDKEDIITSKQIEILKLEREILKLRGEITAIQKLP